METETHAREAFWTSRTREAFRGNTAESLVGLGAAAIAIIGLSRIFPEVLAAVASIAVGVALAFEGGMISARYAALVAGEGAETSEAPMYWGGVTTLFLAGAAGIALGILSLIGVAPMTLIPASVVIFGAALLLDSGANTRLSVLEARYSEELKSKEALIRETAQASAGIQVLVGIAAVIMGILALIGIAPLVLSLASILGIGAANSLTGAMVGGRMSHIFQQ